MTLLDLQKSEEMAEWFKAHARKRERVIRLEPRRTE
jgi:hypothetical protein